MNFEILSTDKLLTLLHDMMHFLMQYYRKYTESHRSDEVKSQSIHM